MADALAVELLNSTAASTGDQGTESGFWLFTSRLTKLFGDWVLAVADDVEGEGEDEPGNVEGDGDDDPDDGGFNIHEPGNVKGEGEGGDDLGDFKFRKPEAGEGDFYFHEHEE